MNEAIELHDSRLAAVEFHGSTAVLTLSPAVLHRSTGRPAVDASSVFGQDFRLELAEASLQGEIGELPADVWDGDFELDGVLSVNLIPLPCEGGKPARLMLHLEPDNRRLTITGTGIRVTPISPARYVEEFT
jgi:hypothetical protein